MRTWTGAATGAISPTAGYRRGSIRARRPVPRAAAASTSAPSMRRIIALDAATGAVCRDFGVNGTVNLRNRAAQRAVRIAEEYELTSPPAVVNGVIVTGSGMADNNRTNAASGEVRAYDARTGALRWTWDPIPRDSTDPAWRTWRGLMAHTTGAANAWSVIAADSARESGIRADHESEPGLLRRRADGRQPVCELHRRAAGVDRRGRVVIPDRASRPLGLRQRLAAGAGRPSRTMARAWTWCSRRPRPGSCSCWTVTPAFPSSRSRSAPCPRASSAPSTRRRRSRSTR